MPVNTFVWHPKKQDAGRVFLIKDDLRDIADAHDVGFYVNAKEEEETEPVVLREEVALPLAVVERLRALATKAGVTIYVHPRFCFMRGLCAIFRVPLSELQPVC